MNAGLGAPAPGLVQGQSPLPSRIAHPTTIAITGATGFLGRHLLAALSARGLHLRVLTRKSPSDGLPHDLIQGDLNDQAALNRLVEGAQIVIHAAGLIKARSRRDFVSVNRDGSARLAQAAQRHAPGAHLIGVSSLAARTPTLSAYAESKRAGEAALADAFTGRLSVLRPPVVYGPWDRETLAIFRTAARPLVPVPGAPDARIALIHATDAAAAIAAVAGWHDAPTGGVHALSDPNPSGYAPRHIFETAATLLGNNPRFFPLPAPAVRAAGLLATLLAQARGTPAILDSGKAREIVYGRWAVTAPELLPAAVFRPQIDLRAGFAATIAWYRQAGWLGLG